MCGIFGVFTDYKNGFSNKQLDILGQNIIINQFRGTDSTGIFQVDQTGKSEMMKVLGGAGSLFNDERWNPFQAQISKSANVVVGHGRAATRGTVTIENAHPFAKTFETGEILKLVHNGTLEYQQDLPDFHKFQVDSEWIAEMIVRYGPLEALTKIQGAMALVWWNEKEKTINFFRNNERPLHFGRFATKWENTFVLNSEAAAVRYLAERNGLTPVKKDTMCYYFAPRTHYALSIDDLFGDWTVCEEYAAPKEKVYTFDYGQSDWWKRRQELMREDDEDDRDRINIWTRKRSYADDIEALQNGDFKIVQFRSLGGDKWERATQLRDFSSVTQSLDVVPYSKGLVKMERIWTSVTDEPPKMWVRMTYKDPQNGKEYYTHVGIPEEKKVEVKTGELIPFKGAPTSWRDADYHKLFVDVGCQKFSPGRRFRWTSKSGATTIRHTAQVANEGGKVLKFYKNDQDGTFEEGQQITIEVTSLNVVELEKVNYLEVEGIRVDSKVDRCVDVVCFFEEHSEEAKQLVAYPDVHQMPFIAGVVDHIELAVKDRHEDTGAYAILVLKDTEFIEAEATEPEKVTLQ